MKTVPLWERDVNLCCCLSSVLLVWYLHCKGGHVFRLPKRNVSQNAKKGKMQVSLHLAHYWIIPA